MRFICQATIGNLDVTTNSRKVGVSKSKLAEEQQKVSQVLKKEEQLHHMRKNKHFEKNEKIL